MSKLDQMRAMREARYAARTSGAVAPKPAPRAEKPKTSTLEPHLTVVPETEPAVSEPVIPELVPATVPAPTDTSRVPTVGEETSPVAPGKPIHLYKPAEIEALVRWITRDGKPRSMDQIIEEGMAQLQFVRRGRKIVESFSRAVETAGVVTMEEQVERAG